jgi:5-formyltetrahydrofolate cyclo-ligase
MCEKEQQRKAGLAARKALDKETARRFSGIISEKLAAEPAFAEAGTILSYQPYAAEVDPSFFHECALREGKRLAFPICREGGLMIAALPNGPEDWETGKHGIRAPLESRSAILDPMDIDLVVVPCIAFEGSTRMRTGWGAGYYDRYLPQCGKAVSIAIAYEAQQIIGLCRDEWDAPLDVILTEANRYCGDGHAGAENEGKG